MTAVELRELTNEELVEALSEAKEERFNLRFQVATNQLDNTARLAEVKKDIARIMTVIRERELADDSVVSEPVSTGAVGVGKESA
jgi:large subunit ribosomal protein L29